MNTIDDLNTTLPCSPSQLVSAAGILSGAIFYWSGRIRVSTNRLSGLKLFLIPYSDCRITTLNFQVLAFSRLNNALTFKETILVVPFRKPAHAEDDMRSKSPDLIDRQANGFFGSLDWRDKTQSEIRAVLRENTIKTVLPQAIARAREVSSDLRKQLNQQARENPILISAVSAARRLDEEIELIDMLVESVVCNIDDASI